MIGRDTALTDRERAYLEETVEALESEVFVGELGPEHVVALDDNEETTGDWRTFVSRAAEHDLLGIPVPEAAGGAGLGYVETVLAEQALGYAGRIVHACQASLTQHIGRTLHDHGDDYLHANYLEPMLAGETVVAQAFTEPTVGTDLARLQTTAERDGDGWVISGEKRFIDFAGHADFLFLPARTSGADGERDGLSLFVVDTEAAGYEILEHQSPGWHGFRGSDVGWIRLSSVRVPDEHLVGEEGAAWSYIAHELALERLTVSRYCLGAAERAVEIAANYTAHREVDGEPLSGYQAVSHALAEAVTTLDAAFLLNTRGARILDAEGLSAGRMEGAMAKWYGADAAHEVADTAMQVMGGIGTTRKYPVERIQRDVRAGRFLGGASEVMKSVVQHDAYERLADEEFRGEYVGAELDGLPWRGGEPPSGGR